MNSINIDVNIPKGYERESLPVEIKMTATVNYTVDEAREMIRHLQLFVDTYEENNCSELLKNIEKDLLSLMDEKQVGDLVKIQYIILVTTRTFNLLNDIPSYRQRRLEIDEARLDGFRLEIDNSVDKFSIKEIESGLIWERGRSY